MSRISSLSIESATGTTAEVYAQIKNAAGSVPQSARSDRLRSTPSRMPKAF